MPSRRRALSDTEIYDDQTKMNNLLYLIVEDLKLETYMATHKFGIVKVHHKDYLLGDMTMVDNTFI